MSHVRSSDDDSGNAAVEVLAVALTGGILVCWLSFGLFTAQRDTFAAHHLARQAARLFVLAGGSDEQVQLLPELAARNLHLAGSEVSVKVVVADGFARAIARVRGATSWAVMEMER